MLYLPIDLNVDRISRTSAHYWVVGYQTAPALKKLNPDTGNMIAKALEAVLCILKDFGLLPSTRKAYFVEIKGFCSLHSTYLEISMMPLPPVPSLH